MKKTTLGSLIVSSALIVACSSGDSNGNHVTDSTALGSGAQGPSRPLREFGDCDELLDWTKGEMLKRVTPYGLDMYPIYFSTGGWSEDVMASATEAPAAADSGADDGAARDDTSNTNTQEAYVDEGDISETDGRYVYTIFDNTLRSVDLDNQTLVSEISLPVGDSQMVLTNEGLYVATSQWDAVATTSVSGYSIVDGKLDWQRTDYLEGRMLSLRVVKRMVHVALHSDFTSRIDFVSPMDSTEKSTNAALERNKEVIGELSADELLPRRFEDRGNGARGGFTRALDCAAVGAPDDFSGWGITWVASIDASQNVVAPTGSLGIVSDSDVVYTSQDAMFSTTTRWNDEVSGDYRPNNPEPPVTAVHKFVFVDGASTIDYQASGVVNGTLLNSYSLSEYEGRLRVATTTNFSDFGGGLDNGVHVLEVDGDQLVEVGVVNGLGRGESIQAVRFDGARAYVVTFRQVDPFFVLDLSNPTRPVLSGELKIRGFSTYLKPIDGNRVIGVGMEGTESGRITGAQVSVFDVSDPANPVQTATARIGDWSSATSDPHAFLWWSPTGTIVVPKDMTCEVIEGCDSAIVLKLDGTSLIEQGGLFQWYPIQRTLIAEGRLVTLSAGGVSVHDLDTLEKTGFVDYGI